MQISGTLLGLADGVGAYKTKGWGTPGSEQAMSTHHAPQLDEPESPGVTTPWCAKECTPGRYRSRARPPRRQAGFFRRAIRRKPNQRHGCREQTDGGYPLWFKKVHC